MRERKDSRRTPELWLGNQNNRVLLTEMRKAAGGADLGITVGEEGVTFNYLFIHSATTYGLGSALGLVVEGM